MLHAGREVEPRHPRHDADALLDVGCDGGDTECCIRLEGIFSLANDKA
jgi:hypothetical protein